VSKAVNLAILCVKLLTLLLVSLIH
jgi:hypothetical protein